MWDTFFRWAEAEWRVMRAAPFAALLCAIIGGAIGWWISDLLHAREAADLRAAVQLDDVRAAAYQEKFCNVLPPAKNAVKLGEALEANAANQHTIKVLEAQLQACVDFDGLTPQQKKQIKQKAIKRLEDGTF